MKRYFFACLFIFCFAFVCFAQQVKPTATPTPVPLEDTDDIVKISTTLVQVDVTVTDKNGKAVTDLKAEDFEIYENGEKQLITNFSYMAPQRADAQAPTNSNKIEGKINNVPVPFAQLRPEQVKRTIAIVVDDLGLSFESVATVRSALRKFVDNQMQPGDLVAIVRASVGSGAFQQFTSDKRQLYSAIEQLKWNPQGRSGISSFAAVEPSIVDQMIAQGVPQQGTPPAGVPNNLSPAQQELLKKFLDDAAKLDSETRKSFEAFRQDIFTAGTLGAINYAVGGMNELPGRKSIMFFSDGFSICSVDQPERCGRMLDMVRKLTDIVNRAGVSIYSFDARGVAVTGLTSEDKVLGASIDAPQPFQNSARQQVQQTITGRTDELYEKQQGMAYLANETGGKAFFNANDLNKSLDAALEDQKGFYLIGYQPQAETFSAETLRYNKLQVKVKREDLSVRYRSGFFGVEDKDIRPATLTANQQIVKALTSPFGVKDINVRINTLFGNDAQNGVYIGSLMHVNLNDLTFSNEANGEKRTTFDVLAASFDEKGGLVEQFSKSITLTIKNEVFEKTLKEGFVYSFIFPIKNPGGYQFSAAVRDAITGKVGSANQFAEVPKMKKNRMALSSIILENFTPEQWRQSNRAEQTGVSTDKTNPLIDTALRKFKRGTILGYSVEIYNAKISDRKQPLAIQTRLFHNGNLMLNGNPVPINLADQKEPKQIGYMGGIKLGVGMPAGDYVLQVIVYDNLSKDGSKAITQWIQFEIAE